ncbi:polyhydroxyalkanoate synthesis repressor PhaR [Sphingosinicella sp. BN140058]|uniref:polyhydroxyalkanoate synthesis repressor PhaR n=1 Tax=Sphingosinicella sp. BN140058 TaxID=1892855 RepID=UPI0010128A94|nr:polyhydroxyalkanoate synthesis repressor PhaR [Sphingosinicella sp. BN140058]QAY75527.1 polyhydroxyalkanoate synthesis repressor PhaR [Sphingosinicella sp. BN140058]
MAAGSGDDVVIIKKYANRRLYDTESSSYITLERLAEMVRQKREFKVVDAKTAEDITHAVLTQIIMDEEARGKTMLPVNFLRQLIGMYGGQMQSLVPEYLEASLEAFQRNQEQFRDALAGAFTGGPFAEMARRNMELFQNAAGRAAPASAKTGAAEPAPPARENEIDRLRNELAALQAKVDKLGK